METQNVDEYEKALNAIQVALYQSREALRIFNGAAPLGYTTRVVNPRGRFVISLGEAIDALEGCTVEFAKMLEAAAIEALQKKPTK